MPLDPFIATFLAAAPPAPQTPTDPNVLRAAARDGIGMLTEQLAEPFPDVPNQRRVDIPVEDGTIELLIYTPQGDEPKTGYVFFFGGGFRVGSVDYPNIDGLCRERCNEADAVVISVGYRLAPAHLCRGQVGGIK